MDSTILAIRAITAYYGRTLLWPVLGIGVAFYLSIFGLSWLLAVKVNVWWWLLVVMVTPLSTFCLFFWLLCFSIIRRIHPRLDTHQRKLVREISAHAAHIAAEMGTPKFVILGRIVRDAVFSTSIRGSYIGELTAEPGEAKRKFDELRRSL